MSQIRAVSLVVLFAASALGAACANRSQVQGTPPTGVQPAGSRPSAILARREMNRPPALNVAADVPRFLDWAGASTTSERETARKAIADASRNDEVVKALAAHVDTFARVDHSRALLALSVLGEMKNPSATRFLVDFINRPLPEKGTVTEEGEILERTAQEMLQSKAVDGLAYMRDQNTDREVLAVIARHPSKIVRAEAISAFLWNHEDSPESKRIVASVVMKGDEIYIDRVRRVAGQDAKAFNTKLAEFLRAHPEAVPPAPEKGRGKAKQDQGTKYDRVPPKF